MRVTHDTHATKSQSWASFHAEQCCCFWQVRRRASPYCLQRTWGTIQSVSSQTGFQSHRLPADGLFFAGGDFADVVAFDKSAGTLTLILANRDVVKISALNESQFLEFRWTLMCAGSPRSDPEQPPSAELFARH